MSCRVFEVTDTSLINEDCSSLVNSVRSFLRDATADGVTHVVFVSSALVYGAWENNPVPLAESEPARPNPECSLARAFSAAETLVETWRQQEQGRTAAVLRAVPTIDPPRTMSWVTALAHAAGSEMSTSVAGAQFVHASDVRAAVDVCATHRVDGVLNVAPDGYITGERLRALATRPLYVRLPAWARSTIEGLRWTLERGPIEPGLRAYARHTWVVSNDRLKALGWQQTMSNEEAYVEGTEGSVWDGLSARRRQEVALAGAGAAIVTTLWVVARTIGRARARRPR